MKRQMLPSLIQVSFLHDKIRVIFPDQYEQIIDLETWHRFVSDVNKIDDRIRTLGKPTAPLSSRTFNQKEIT